MYNNKFGTSELSRAIYANSDIISLWT